MIDLAALLSQTPQDAEAAWRRTLEPLPPLRIEVGKTVEEPLWLEASHYRAQLPARAVGGNVGDRLTMTIGNDPPQPLRLTSEFEDLLVLTPEVQRLRSAAERGDPIVVSGLSRTLNVLGGFHSMKAGFVLTRLALLQGVRDAGLPIWVDLDDYGVTTTYDSVRRGMRLLTERLLGRPYLLPMEEWSLRCMYETERQAAKRGLHDLVAAAHGVVVATPALAEVVRPHNLRVFVIPNAIDPDAMAQTVRRRTRTPLRVGMSGTTEKFRNNDLKAAMPALLAAGRNPDVQLHFYGGRPQGDDALIDVQPDLDLPGTATRGVAKLNGVPYHWQGRDDDILAFQRAIGLLDISVHPLRPDIAHNRFRSGQSWMERALHSTPCVLQRHPPHWQATEEETCLKAETPEEWTEPLLRLVNDATLRRRIGEAARAEVLAHHTLEARRPLWEALVAAASGARVAA
jgi:hypothetical protein